MNALLRPLKNAVLAVWMIERFIRLRRHAEWRPVPVRHAGKRTARPRAAGELRHLQPPPALPATEPPASPAPPKHTRRRARGARPELSDLYLRSLLQL